MPKATELLKKDHETVEGLFAKFEKEKDPSSKEAQGIAQQIMVELQAHAQLEEELFYPAMQDTDPKAVPLVSEAITEHQGVEHLMTQIEGFSAGSEEYKAQMTTLMSNVRHHVEEEEKEMFPLAEKTLGGKLDEIGKQIETRKKEVLQKAS
jgi:hemerythrin superfamily protein